MIIAEWKIEGLFRADAQKVYEEIGDRKITPEQVLEIAKNKKTELHKCFEWDDSKAANKYRLIQAQTIIRTLVVRTEQPDDLPVRIFQTTTVRNEYQPMRMFLTDKDEYEALLKRCKNELKDIRNRYKQLSEMEEIFTAIDAL